MLAGEQSLELLREWMLGFGEEFQLPFHMRCAW